MGGVCCRPAASYIRSEKQVKMCVERKTCRKMESSCVEPGVLLGSHLDKCGMEEEEDGW